MSRPLNFTSEKERSDWLIENAEYFCLVNATKRGKRLEFRTLPEAQAVAKYMIKLYPKARLMIYAVHGQSDVWVESVLGRENYAGGNSPLRRDKSHQT